MGRAQEEQNRRLLRARDAIDRGYGAPVDVPALARVALMSKAHFIRTFKQTFGETPGRYLQRRRIERAMALLRTSEMTIGEICVEVGFVSAATFARQFKEIVGETPSAFRARGHTQRGDVPALVPTCFEKAWTRPSVQAIGR
jgi:transcriptional regulator GlxA family with amidase domain